MTPDLKLKRWTRKLIICVIFPASRNDAHIAYIFKNTQKAVYAFRIHGGKMKPQEQV